MSASSASSGEREDGNNNRRRRRLRSGNYLRRLTGGRELAGQAVDDDDDDDDDEDARREEEEDDGDGDETAMTMASDMFSFLLDRPPICPSVYRSTYLCTVSRGLPIPRRSSLSPQRLLRRPPPASDQTRSRSGINRLAAHGSGGKGRLPSGPAAAPPASKQRCIIGSGTLCLRSLACPPVFPLPRHRLPPVRRIGGRQHAIQARQADHHR